MHCICNPMYRPICSLIRSPIHASVHAEGCTFCYFRTLQMDLTFFQLFVDRIPRTNNNKNKTTTSNKKRNGEDTRLLFSIVLHGCRAYLGERTSVLVAGQFLKSSSLPGTHRAIGGIVSQLKGHLGLSKHSNRGSSFF